VGDVVVWGYTGNGEAAFLFTDQLGFKKLNDIIPQGSGWNAGRANSINDSGQIVGSGVLGGQTGWQIFRMQLPSANKASCDARAVCGGGGGNPVCLYSEGVVETSPGHFVALFGWDNASSSAVQPAQNEVRLDGDLVRNPQPAPPGSLAAGTHSAAFL